MDRDIDIIRYEFLRLKLDTKTLDDTCIYIYTVNINGFSNIS